MTKSIQHLHAHAQSLLDTMREATALDREHVLDGTEHLIKASDIPLVDLTSSEAHKAAHGRKVFVYFNLHKKLWSVKDLGTGRVILHSKNLSLQNPVFKVSEAGRQRVIAEQRKNVHAGVVGTLDTVSEGKEPEGSKKVSYNPYKAAHFYEVGTGTPVHSGNHAHMSVEEKINPEGKTVRIPHVFVHNVDKD